MAIKNYDVNQFTITLVGPTVNHVVSGFAKGTFFSFSMDEDILNYEVVTNGDVIVCDKNNYAGKATITLSQASPSNAVFSRLAMQKRITGVRAEFAIQIKDNNGSTLITSPGASILSPNNIDYADSISNRVWTILLSDATVFIGGIN